MSSGNKVRTSMNVSVFAVSSAKTWKDSSQVHTVASLRGVEAFRLPVKQETAKVWVD